MDEMKLKANNIISKDFSKGFLKWKISPLKKKRVLEYEKKTTSLYFF